MKKRKLEVEVIIGPETSTIVTKTLLEAMLKYKNIKHGISNKNDIKSIY